VRPDWLYTSKALWKRYFFVLFIIYFLYWGDQQLSKQVILPSPPPVLFYEHAKHLSECLCRADEDQFRLRGWEEIKEKAAPAVVEVCEWCFSFIPKETY
jgi:hypothetical protein